MAFDVYPAAATPLSLGPGADSGLVAFNAHASGAPGDLLRKMFLRVAMSSSACGAPLTGMGHDPTVSLQVDTGAEVPLALGGSETAILNGSGFEADATMVLQANAVYLIVVNFVAPNTPDKFVNWKIRIKNHDPDAAGRTFAWVTADSDTDSQQPWIQVAPTALNYDVLINQDPMTSAESVHLTNKGTGILTITGVNPALGASFTTLPAFPFSLLPCDCKDLSVTFKAPAASGTTNASFTTACNDTVAAHNPLVTLNATTQELELVLLLDTSGSMDSSDASPTRWKSLEVAADQFLEYMKNFGGNHGNFGVARFPSSDGTPVGFDIVRPAETINIANIGPVETTLHGISPTNSTPMGDGIARTLDHGTLYFQWDATSVNTNRRWLLLMSDGANNSGTADPNAEIAPLVTGKITVFSMAYGDPNGTQVDHALLSKIAANSYNGGTYAGNNYMEAGTHTPVQLANAFKGLILSGLAPAYSGSDPDGVLTSAAPEARQKVLVTPYDTKAAFTLNWETFDPERMTLQLLTPNCELITPASQSTDPNITFYQNPRCNMYTIGRNYLRNAADPTRPRYGTWTMIISSRELQDAREGRENYSYDLIVESGLKMDVRLDRPQYFAGDSVGLSATLTVQGVPISNATVTAQLTAPAQSGVNWLAGLTFTADELARAREALHGVDVTQVRIKEYAAFLKQLFPPGGTVPNLLTLTEGPRGVYTATLNQTPVPGRYSFYITAIGQTADGVNFRREKRLDIRVGVRPDPVYTLVDIAYQVQDGVVQATIRLTPRDRFGNVILIDPTISSSISLTARGAEFTGPLVGNLDGSYTRVLRYRATAAPQLALEVDGHPIFTGRALNPVSKLIYVNEVVSFTPGHEAAKGANRHPDPRAALGSVLTKSPDTFVSLGAYGVLTVAVQKQKIVAQGADDITIFVHPDSDLRSYRVEVLPVITTDTRSQWVRLGESSGITQSFSLRSVKVAAASAIRITDTSGRTRDAQLQPLSTPGVSIRGVGVKKVTSLST